MPSVWGHCLFLSLFLAKSSFQGFSSVMLLTCKTRANSKRKKSANSLGNAVSHLLQSLLFRWFVFKTPFQNVSFGLNGISGIVLNNYVSVSFQNMLDESTKRNKPNIETREDVFGLPWNCLRVVFELANKYHLYMYDKSIYVCTTWFTFCNFSKACDRISNKCKQNMNNDWASAFFLRWVRMETHLFCVWHENS